MEGYELMDWSLTQQNEFGNTQLHYDQFLGRNQLLSQKNKNGYTIDDLTGISMTIYELLAPYPPPTPLPNLFEERKHQIKRLENIRTQFRQNFVEYNLEIPYLSVVEKRHYLQIITDLIREKFHEVVNQKTICSLLDRIYWNSKYFFDVNDFDKNGKQSFNCFLVPVYVAVMQIVCYYHLASEEFLGENVFDSRLPVGEDDPTKANFCKWFFEKTLRYFPHQLYDRNNFQSIMIMMISYIKTCYRDNDAKNDLPMMLSKEIEFMNIRRVQPLEHKLTELIYSTLDESQYLKRLKDLFPEIQWYQYKHIIDITPDMTAELVKPNHIHVEILYGSPFATHAKDRTIAEINKFLIRLIYLRDIICGKNFRFPQLSQENFNQLRSFVLSIVQNEEQLQFLMLSLIWDDLGRTQPFQDAVNHREGVIRPRDHDEYLRLFFQHYRRPEHLHHLDEYLGSFKLLTEQDQRIYLNQISNTFNLGAFVQGESVPYSLYQFFRSCPTIMERKYRLVIQLLSFLAVGHSSTTFQSLLFDDVSFHQYMVAIEMILNNDRHVSSARCREIYSTYLNQRALAIGAPHDDAPINEERYAVYRVISLARAKYGQWGEVLSVWTSLPHTTRDALISYLNFTGFTQETAIYIYYAPAIIANAITSFEKDRKSSNSWPPFMNGLYHGLEEILKIYRQIEEELIHGRLQASGRTKHYGGLYIYYAQKNAEKMKTFNY